MLAEIGMEQRKREALRIAESAFLQTTDWVAFFRQTVAVNGRIHQLFLTPEELAEFEQSQEFREIRQMITKLREKRPKKKDRNTDREPTKVITVRMPKSLHESLREQADQLGTSINELCISKLLQMIES